MTDYKNIIVEKNNSTLLVTINRERALNALNKETIAELQSAFDEYQSDSAIRCVIVTGAGSKSFVAGADIAELSELDQAG
ncbi:MAG: enoyl-CoA hydratase/isomerase family protein, partial [candidate division Zixibacteria bacterium]|nr:enoyl-CoA hydratase/isomerase family protein [candidate division Zixibacteria bacterium]